MIIKEVVNDTYVFMSVGEFMFWIAGVLALILCLLWIVNYAVKLHNDRQKYMKTLNDKEYRKYREYVDKK